MSRPKLATVLRTVRHLRGRQVAAQLRHLVVPARPLATWSGPPPGLARRESVAPFLPSPPHARLLVESSAGSERPAGVELINRGVSWDDAIVWNETGESPLFEYHLHQCDYLRAPSLSARMRARVVLDWVLRHPAGVGWDPHPMSLRLLTWGKLLLTPGGLALEEDEAHRVLASLGAQAITLSQNLEVRLQANHLLSNLLGVVWAGLLLEGESADRWLERTDLLRRELAEQVPADGLHYERSPMYHALLLENVLDLTNLARGVPERTPAGLLDDLEGCAARMAGALSLVTHPDGEIALFADAALGIAHPPSVLAAYAASLGIEPDSRPERTALLRDAGFVRLEQGPYCLIASVGGPSPTYMPGHSHCDALAFELSVGGRRVVTDTGVAEYVPGTLREGARATRSHATLQLDGHEQAELWSAFRIGGRPRVEIGETSNGRVEATCRGHATHRSLHRRAFELGADGVTIHDVVEGRPTHVRFPLPLAPGLEPVLETDAGASSARIDLGASGTLRIDLPSGLAWTLERAPYFPEFGRVVERACLVGEGRPTGAEALRFRLD